MKKLFSLITALFALSAFPASAIVGGPWDGNNFMATNGGVYNGVVILQNGMGMFRFSDPGDTFDQFQTDVPGSPRSDQGVVFYKGAVYSGTIFGMADWNNREVNAIFNGDVQQGTDGAPGPNLNAIDDDLNFHDSNRSIQICNFFFKGEFTDDAPIMRFSGKGRANFFGLLDTLETTVTTTTTVIVGDTEEEAEAVVTSVGGEAPLPETIGEETSIYVYGSQIRSFSGRAGL
jgi:hypothetical protein